MICLLQFRNINAWRTKIFSSLLVAKVEKLINFFLILAYCENFSICETFLICESFSSCENALFGVTGLCKKSMKPTVFLKSKHAYDT